MKTNSRKEKISLLKGILKGEKNICDSMPPQILVFVRKKETGNYYCPKLQREFTEEEYKKYGTGTHHALKIIRIVVTRMETAEILENLK